LTANPLEALPPAYRPTEPDPVPPEAWRALGLLPGESPLAAWRTPHGFLVLTNLRCIALANRLQIFGPRDWHAAPEFYFYNLRPPRVLFGRFVELAEEYDENGWVGRYAVVHPEEVARRIGAELAAGRVAWQARRSHTEELARARAQARAEQAARHARQPVYVRCSFCGNLVDASRGRCPDCGAAMS
jgi:RNA polymerase subunit RPABC4/transcription elongation factor Spt4